MVIEKKKRTGFEKWTKWQSEIGVEILDQCENPKSKISVDIDKVIRVFFTVFPPYIKIVNTNN